MIRLLQTGDLHLGKLFYEYPLVEDQKQILSQLIGELTAAEIAGLPYDALLITGDIYDRSIPPPDAVELFSSFLSDIKKRCPQLHVFIISGNHDSPRRLGFAAALLDSRGIHICTAAEPPCLPVFLGSRQYTASEAADGTAEIVAVYQIPFLIPGSIPTSETGAEENPAEAPLLRNQHDMFAQAAQRIACTHQLIQEQECCKIPAILCAHAFVIDGERSESERLFLGTAEQVDAGQCAPFAYTALGHLHKPQKTADRIWYAGSPLAYSFDEAGTEKCFLRISIDCDGTALPPVTVEKIPVQPLHQVRRISTSFERIYRTSDFDTYAGDFLEISCTDTSIVENPAALLRTRFPLIMSVKQEAALEQTISRNKP
jgi:exonuclease SbcD